MDLGLTNKIAAVCASSSGLGFATAMILAEEGCKVSICGRNFDKLKSACQQINAKYPNSTKAFNIDLSEKNGAESFIEQTAQHYDNKLDIAIANMGGPLSSPYDKLSKNDWQQAINNIVLTTNDIFSTAIPYLKKNKSGRLLVITSISALQPLANMVLSNTLRAGIHGLIKTLAGELAPHNITINAICPGFTLTERMIDLCKQQAKHEKIDDWEEILKQKEHSLPFKRFANPSEFASAATFLCSNQASYISGTTLPVDGAYTAIR